MDVVLTPPLPCQCQENLNGEAFSSVPSHDFRVCELHHKPAVSNSGQFPEIPTGQHAEGTNQGPA